jgi:hypothetical protein
MRVLHTELAHCGMVVAPSIETVEARHKVWADILRTSHRRSAMSMLSILVSRRFPSRAIG